MFGRPGLLAISTVLLLLAAFLTALALSYSSLGRYLGSAVISVVPNHPGIPGLATMAQLSDREAAFVFTVILLVLLAIIRLWRGTTRNIKRLALTFVAFHVPGILSHSSVNWLRFLLQQPISFRASPLLETTALALGTAACLVLFYLVMKRREDISTFRTAIIEESDQIAYVRGMLSLGLAVVGGALVITTAALFLALSVSHGLGRVFEYLPWPVVLLGLVAVVVISGVVYVALSPRSRQVTSG